MEELDLQFEIYPIMWARDSCGRLVLSQPVRGLTGATFSLDNVPKAGFVFTKSGNKLETGTDFRWEKHNVTPDLTEEVKAGAEQYVHLEKWDWNLQTEDKGGGRPVPELRRAEDSHKSVDSCSQGNHPDALHGETHLRQ